MRAFIQRSKSAHVSVDNKIVGQIDQGLVVLLGIGSEDTLDKGKKLIDKVLKYRVFDDENGKMGWNVAQANGGVLLISHYTPIPKKDCAQTLHLRCHQWKRKRYMMTY